MSMDPGNETKLESETIIFRVTYCAEGGCEHPQAAHGELHGCSRCACGAFRLPADFGRADG